MPPIKTKAGGPKETEVDKKPDADKKTTFELREKGCTVYYEKSATKNLGNYESAKVTVGITIPILPTKEEVSQIERTIEIAEGIVMDELEVQLKELDSK